jgi:hypothetical protein
MGGAQNDGPLSRLFVFAQGVLLQEAVEAVDEGKGSEEGAGEEEVGVKEAFGAYSSHCLGLQRMAWLGQVLQAVGSGEDEEEVVGAMVGACSEALGQSLQQCVGTHVALAAHALAAKVGKVMHDSAPQLYTSSTSATTEEGEQGPMAVWGPRLAGFGQGQGTQLGDEAWAAVQKLLETTQESEEALQCCVEVQARLTEASQAMHSTRQRLQAFEWGQEGDLACLASAVPSWNYAPITPPQHRRAAVLESVSTALTPLSVVVGEEGQQGGVTAIVQHWETTVRGLGTAMETAHKATRLLEGGQGGGGSGQWGSKARAALALVTKGLQLAKSLITAAQGILALEQGRKDARHHVASLDSLEASLQGLVSQHEGSVQEARRLRCEAAGVEAQVREAAQREHARAQERREALARRQRIEEGKARYSLLPPTSQAAGPQGEHKVGLGREEAARLKAALGEGGLGDVTAMVQALIGSHGKTSHGTRERSALLGKRGRALARALLKEATCLTPHLQRLSEALEPLCEASSGEAGAEAMEGLMAALDQGAQSCDLQVGVWLSSRVVVGGRRMVERCLRLGHVADKAGRIKQQRPQQPGSQEQEEEESEEESEDEEEGEEDEEEESSSEEEEGAAPEGRAMDHAAHGAEAFPSPIALGVAKRMGAKLEGGGGVGEQVESLVAQATAPDRLCVMYEGWTPWF